MIRKDNSMWKGHEGPFPTKWVTKFAWWFTKIKDRDGDTVLLWLEYYEEHFLDQCRIERRLPNSSHKFVFRG